MPLAEKTESTAGQLVSKGSLPQDENYQEYLDFFEEVFQTMKNNYYQEVSRKEFDRFIQLFDSKIYPQLRHSGKSVDYIRWRSASRLVHILKSKEDIFSEFYPPKPADKYKKTALGKKVDVGVEGETTEEGYEVALVEPRSGASVKGLNEGDVILTINGQDVAGLDPAIIDEMLKPKAGEKVTIEYKDGRDGLVKEMDIESEEYFKQTVFMIPTGVPMIYGLQVQRFNRKTSEDFFKYMALFRSQGPIKGLILDFRDNPGGPPLAAQEISSFFLPPGEEFAFFQKKGHPKALLEVPKIPEKYHYEGPMAILINKESGSAAELFSGVMQRKGRAVLMGTNSAGQVMLKSMFPFDDGSMLLLITSRGHHADGKPFSFRGLTPNRVIREGAERDPVKYATTYLLYMNKEEQEKNR